jgi:hypothetical protein
MIREMLGIAEGILQDLHRRSDLKVLFTTGYAQNAIIHHGRLDPGVQLIVKPFNFAGLAAKIRQIFDKP